MLNTDQQVLDQSLEPPVAKVAAKSRTLPFIAQVVAMSALFAVGMFGFAWWQAGSVDLVWPWLRGDRLVFEPTRIDCGDVLKSAIIEKPIRVVNLSSKPLSLLGSQESCSCITLGEFPVVIPPGKEHHLKLKIGVSQNAGPFEHSIKFFSDDRGYSTAVVTISGVVQ